MLLWILVGLCVLAGVLAFLLLPGESDGEQREPFWGVCLAHRGLHGPEAPENSMAAFTAAADAGYGIELDIRLTRDGEVVVFHDDTLERLCGLAKRVDALTLAEVQALPLLHTEQRVPTLRQVLALVDQRVPLLVEVKHGPQNAELCDRAWRILRCYDGEIAVESFDPRIVRWFRQKAPGLLRGQLAARPSTLKQGAAGYLVGWMLANFWGRPHFIAYQWGARPLLARIAMRFGMRVAWTVKPGDDFDAVCAASDAVIFEGFAPPARYDAGLPAPDTDPAPDAGRERRRERRRKKGGEAGFGAENEKAAGEEAPAAGRAEKG